MSTSRQVGGALLVMTAFAASSSRTAEAAPASVTVPLASVRTAPWEGAPIVATLPASQGVVVSDEVTNGWRLITLADGRSGYVSDGEILVVVAHPPPAVVDSGGAASTAIRVSARATGLSLDGLGLELSRRLVSMVGIDATASYEDFGNGHTGLGAEALLRLYASDTRHLVSVGVGPSVSTAREYGPVGFASAEIAYEYRPFAGPSVLAGGGVSFGLNNSGDATCSSGSAFFACGLFWNSSYHAGDAHLRLRVAVGGSFESGSRAVCTGATAVCSALHT